MGGWARRGHMVGSLSHHVVVVVPLDDVGRRQQLLLDGGGRGRGRLGPGLEQVRHVEDLAGETRQNAGGLAPCC